MSSQVVSALLQLKFVNSSTNCYINDQWTYKDQQISESVLFMHILYPPHTADLNKFRYKCHSSCFLTDPIDIYASICHISFHKITFQSLHVAWMKRRNPNNLIELEMMPTNHRILLLFLMNLIPIKCIPYLDSVIEQSGEDFVPNVTPYPSAQEPSVTLPLFPETIINDGSGHYKTDPLSPNYHKYPNVNIEADPDLGRRVPAMIKSRGFKVQIHKVVTPDGYILQHHRIVNPVKKSKINRPPVILSHGLMSSSNLWLMGSPGGHINDPLIPIRSNLGFALAQRGYDVWLMNIRGNYYTTRHTKLDPRKPKFWDFSFDEFIKYDLPTTIDYILSKTNKKTVQYVGHSQGTLIMFGLLSTQLKYNDLVKPYIALSPATFFSHETSVLRPLVIPFREYFLYKTGPGFRDSFFRTYLSKLCTSGLTVACAVAWYAILGGTSSGQLNTSRIHVYAGDDSLETSNKNLAHYGNLQLSNRFEMFDYGPKGNMNKYGQLSPPIYNLSSITNQHIAMISGYADRAADPIDVQILKENLEGN